MTAQARPQRLGRGLAALIGTPGEQPTPQQVEGHRMAPISSLRASRFNPRQSFPEDQLEELANSIRAKGLVQALLVRPVEGEAGMLEIVAGERRWRAAQKAGLHEVPVIVRRLNDQDALEVAIIENVQRTDLNALEEARGYRDLKDRFGYSQEELAQAIGKSRSHLANTLRLLNLPKEVQSMVSEGRLSPGHARALIGRENAVDLARAISSKGLTVRQAEALGQAAKPRPKETAGGEAARDKSLDTRALEKRLAEVLGLRVEIRPAKGEAGEMTIRYRTLEQLDHVSQRLLASSD